MLPLIGKCLISGRARPDFIGIYNNMRLFDQDIVDLLNSQCDGEKIHYVGLGQFDFQLAFGRVEGMQNTLKVTFSINGTSYLWEQTPCNAPVWLIIGKIPERFSLVAPDQICMMLKGGDEINFFTSEEPYESHTVNLPSEDSCFVMEVY